MRQRRKQAFTKFSQSLENSDQPLHSLLGTFGKIIPQRQKQGISGQISPLYFALQRQDEERIELSLLRFYTLNKVANIEIEWVDSLSLHLDFDTCRKRLSVFRLPSLCLIMSYCEDESPLSQ
jgi:hypothetical protein